MAAVVVIDVVVMVVADVVDAVAVMAVAGRVHTQVVGVVAAGGRSGEVAGADVVVVMDVVVVPRTPWPWWSKRTWWWPWS